MTSASAESDLLMCCASFMAWPVTLDFEGRSEPARSMSVSAAPLSFCVSVVTVRTLTTSIECEREDCSFIAVEVMARLPLPCVSTSTTSSAELTGTSVRFSMKTPSVALRRISSDFCSFFGMSRSWISSL